MKHEFQLRHDFVVSLLMPDDLSHDEARRFAAAVLGFPSSHDSPFVYSAELFRNELKRKTCQIGTCFETAVGIHCVYVMTSAIPPDGPFEVDLSLCQRHLTQFDMDGLQGVITAYGDQIVAVGFTTTCDQTAAA